MKPWKPLATSAVTAHPPRSAPHPARPLKTPLRNSTEAHTGACCSGEAPKTQHGYTSNKEAHLKRLRRIEGQVRGIARMVDEDKYCIDILTQVAVVS